MQGIDWPTLEVIRALSIRQPLAESICGGIKTVEYCIRPGREACS